MFVKLKNKISCFKHYESIHEILYYGAPIPLLAPPVDPMSKTCHNFFSIGRVLSKNVLVRKKHSVCLFSKTFCYFVCFSQNFITFSKKNAFLTFLPNIFRQYPTNRKKLWQVFDMGSRGGARSSVYFFRGGGNGGGIFWVERKFHWVAITFSVLSNIPKKNFACGGPKIHGNRWGGGALSPSPSPSPPKKYILARRGRSSR